MSNKFSLWNIFRSRPTYDFPKKDVKKAPNMKVQWTKFIVALVLYLLFIYWLKSWWGLIVVPFIFDVYITKKRHSLKFIREITAHGRLSLRK